MTVVLTFICLSICFTGFGLGILFFNRKNIGGDCGTAPGEKKGSCLSEEMGICPLDDKDGYLRMATVATRSKKPLGDR